MSRRAREERKERRRWARPGSRHDLLVGLGKWIVPALAVATFGWLAVAPFLEEDDSSFILDKTEVDRAEERMRVEKARYRGEDDKGRRFLIVADEAVQESSRVPVVVIQGMAARLATDEGPILVSAPLGRYDIEEKLISVPRSIRLRGGDGYRLDTSDVIVDLEAGTVRSDGPVSGAHRLGEFSAGGMTADLDQRSVTLTGRARLQIRQGAVR